LHRPARRRSPAASRRSATAPAMRRASLGTDPLHRRYPALLSHWRYHAEPARPAASYERSRRHLGEPLLYWDVVNVILEVARSDQRQSVRGAPLGVAGNPEDNHSESVPQTFG